MLHCPWGCPLSCSVCWGVLPVPQSAAWQSVAHPVTIAHNSFNTGVIVNTHGNNDSASDNDYIAMMTNQANSCRDMQGMTD